MGMARSQFDGSNQCFNHLCMTAPLLRNIVREGYAIEGGCCGDIMSVLCCGPCAACQLIHEVRDRGSRNAYAVL
jgi:Cys-rich protein (TIGR01571 family)